MSEIKLSNNCKFIEELDFDLLYSKYCDHRRLALFLSKGLDCVCCERLGTRLILSEDNGGHLHIDLFTDDYILMTVDHIIPKASGGDSSYDNKQPMCELCNHLKGSKNVTIEELREIINNKFIDSFISRIIKLNIYNTLIGDLNG